MGIWNGGESIRPGNLSQQESFKPVWWICRILTMREKTPEKRGVLLGKLMNTKKWRNTKNNKRRANKRSAPGEFAIGEELI